MDPHELTLDPAYERYQSERRTHWEQVAERLKTWKGWGGAYQRRLAKIYRYLIPEGQRVLEIGCGAGHLLAALKPAYGVGVDFSAGMVERARSAHPQLHFVQADAQIGRAHV